MTPNTEREKQEPMPVEFPYVKSGMNTIITRDEVQEMVQGIFQQDTVHAVRNETNQEAEEHGIDNIMYTFRQPK